MKGKKGVMLMLVTLVLGVVCGISSAKSVVVGGSTGWSIPTSPSLYSNWASKLKLHAGDVLVFNFPASAHTVAQVTKSNYNSCTSTSTIGSILTTAPANFTLTKPGTYYFICTVTGHCTANQKLSVTVSTSVSSPASAPAPAPTPTSSSTLPISPVASGPSPSGDVSGSGSGSGSGLESGSASPPAGNFACSTSVGVLSLVSLIFASALLF